METSIVLALQPSLEQMVQKNGGKMANEFYQIMIAEISNDELLELLSLTRIETDDGDVKIQTNRAFKPKFMV